MSSRAAQAVGLWTAVLLNASCSSTPASPHDALGNTAPPGPRDAGADSPSSVSTDGAPDEGVIYDGNATDSQGIDASSNDGPAIDARVSDAPGQADSPPPAPRCDPTHAWMPSSQPVPSVPQAGFGRLGGIAADELTVAWTSAAGAISVADRPARAGPFGPPTTIDTTSVPVAMDRVALDASGMVVFAVSADRAKFIAFGRSGVGAPWNAVAPLQFANVHAMASAEVGSQFFDPVLGADGRSFYYVLSSSGGPPVLYESKWDVQTDAWATGVALPNPELSSADAGMPTYATGASSDGLTLFFHDGASANERAAWRDTPTSPFVRFVDIPGLLEAAPSYRCDTLYFQGVALGAGVFIAE